MTRLVSEVAGGIRGADTEIVVAGVRLLLNVGDAGKVALSGIWMLLERVWTWGVSWNNACTSTMTETGSK
jgi:hypothetical protein